MILGIPEFVHSPVDRIDSSRYRIVLEIHLLGTEYLGIQARTTLLLLISAAILEKTSLDIISQLLEWAFLAFPFSIERVTVEWLSDHTMDSVG